MWGWHTVVKVDVNSVGHVPTHNGLSQQVDLHKTRRQGKKQIAIGKLADIQSGGDAAVPDDLPCVVHDGQISSAVIVVLETEQSVTGLHLVRLA